MNINHTTSQTNNHISFRCPDTIREQLEAVIARTVLDQSSRSKLYRLTRTQLILDAIINYYQLELPETLEQTPNGVTIC